MGVSKVKSTKQKIRLQARVEGWEKTIKSLPTNTNPKAYRKPGSNKK